MGLTLLEVAISLLFLLGSLLGLSALFVVNQRSFETAAEEAEATHTFRLMAESVRSTPFAEIGTKYNNYNYPLSDPYSTATIRTFLNETDNSADAKVLGLPRDLNGDGVATSTNVDAKYFLLPVKLQFTWTGRNGTETRTQYLLLAEE